MSIIQLFRNGDIQKFKICLLSGKIGFRHTEIISRKIQSFPVDALEDVNKAEFPISF